MHPFQHWRKHRGGRGGIKHWLQPQPHGSFLSSILLANVQDNTLDDLCPHISFQQDIRNCNVLFFTEAWLNPGIPDSAIQPGGGHCVPGHGHQPAGHAGAGEVGEVQWPPAVLCHHAAHRDSQAARGICL